MPGQPVFERVRRSLSADTSTRPRSSSFGSNDKPCPTRETPVAKAATGSLFAANRRSHSILHEHPSCAVGHRATLPEEAGAMSSQAEFVRSGCIRAVWHSFSVCRNQCRRFSNTLSGNGPCKLVPSVATMVAWRGTPPPKIPNPCSLGLTNQSMRSLVYCWQVAFRNVVHRPGIRMK